MTGARAPRTMLQAAEVAAPAAPSRARRWAVAVRQVPPAPYVTGASISTTKTLQLDDPDGARGAPLSPHTAQRKPPFSPASQRVGAPTHAHLAAAHALPGEGKRETSVSGLARRPRRFSPPPPPRFSARCCGALEAPESWPRRGEAALADRLDRSADPEGWPYGRRQRNPLLSGLRGGAGVGFSYSHAELHVTVNCLAQFVTAVGV